MCLSTFMKPFNLKNNADRGTMYSKIGLMCQLVPSLEMAVALRLLFDIPGGVGRILTIDESMTCRYDQDEQSWTN